MAKTIDLACFTASFFGDLLALWEEKVISYIEIYVNKLYISTV